MIAMRGICLVVVTTLARVPCSKAAVGDRPQVAEQRPSSRSALGRVKAPIMLRRVRRALIVLHMRLERAGDAKHFPVQGRIWPLRADVAL